MNWLDSSSKKNYKPANDDLKRVFNILSDQGMKIKASLRFHLTAVRMDNKKANGNNS